MLAKLSAVAYMATASALMPWQDWTLPVDQRVDDLFGRLTPTEIINQTWSIAPGIARFNITAYNWRSNCVHGWSASGGNWLANETWTTFPAPIALAASWDRSLVRAVGVVTSTEGRALHNIALPRNNGASAEARGLNCFAPNVNVLRDFRWGRNQEVLGEDPFMIGEMALQYTLGLQVGEAPQYIKVAGCGKHYAVHDGPDDLRETITYNVSERDLWDFFLPAYRTIVTQGSVAQVMCAYSGVNRSSNAPDCANPYLLQTVLREAMGFDGMVISDNGAVAMVWATHHWPDADNATSASAACINAGCDNDLGHDAQYPGFLPEAIQLGMTSLDNVTRSAKRNLKLRFQMGEFDPDYLVPYKQLGWNDIDTPAHKALNLQSARESLVLLQNNNSVLPIAGGNGVKIAVVGPSAQDETVLLGNYNGIPSTMTSVAYSAQQIGQSNGATVTTASGCGAASGAQACNSSSTFGDALAAAQGANYIVFVGGLDQALASEGHDWSTNSACDGVATAVGDLPGCQSQLVAALAAANPSAKIIVVVVSGSPMVMPATEQIASSVIIAGYPGSLGGQAIAEALFGAYNPGGRLPYSVPADPSQLPDMSDVQITTPPGRTYRYVTGNVRHPFGYGLSYTTFSYSNLAISSGSIAPCQDVTVNVTLTNTGSVDGDEVVQVYLTYPSSTPAGIITPQRALRQFARVTIPAGVSTVVSLTLGSDSFALVDGNGFRQVIPGQYNVFVGGQQPDQVQSCGQAPLQTSVTVTGSGLQPYISCPGATQ